MTRTPDLLPGTLDRLIPRALEKDTSGRRQLTLAARASARMSHASERVPRCAP